MCLFLLFELKLFFQDVSKYHVKYLKRSLIEGRIRGLKIHHKHNTNSSVNSFIRQNRSKTTRRQIKLFNHQYSNISGNWTGYIQTTTLL